MDVPFILGKSAFFGDCHYIVKHQDARWLMLQPAAKVYKWDGTWTFYRQSSTTRSLTSTGVVTEDRNYDVDPPNLYQRVTEEDFGTISLGKIPDRFLHVAFWYVLSKRLGIRDYI